MSKPVAPERYQTRFKLAMAQLALLEGVPTKEEWEGTIAYCSEVIELVKEIGAAEDKVIELEADNKRVHENYVHLETQFEAELGKEQLRTATVIEELQCINREQTATIAEFKEVVHKYQYESMLWRDKVRDQAATIERLKDIDLLWDNFSQALETIDQGQVQEESVMRYKDFKKCLDAVLKQESK